MKNSKIIWVREERLILGDEIAQIAYHRLLERIRCRYPLSMKFSIHGSNLQDVLFFTVAE